MSLSWKSISLNIKEAHLPTILRCGQSFRWKQINNTWSLAYKGRVIFLKQEDDKLYYSSLYPDSQTENITEDTDIKPILTSSSPLSSSTPTLTIVYDYFNLNIDLSTLYNDWTKRDSQFKKKANDFPGIRILRQDPWENICSFICSTNNNIKRISQMVDNLCIHFGDYITTHDGIDYYDFPTPDQLSDPSVESKLRSLGFGYRAKYIQKTAAMVASYESDKLSPSSTSPGLTFLSNLRNLSYEEAHQELLKFSGVGPKVADCVCLMSLDKHDCVPVDTHVWQIAQRDYKFGRKFKSLNKTAYDDIRIFFRDLWGPYAGWAHSVLFTADLRDLNNGLNTTTIPQTLPSSQLTHKRSTSIIASPNIPKRHRPAIIKAEAN